MATKTREELVRCIGLRARALVQGQSRPCHVDFSAYTTDEDVLLEACGVAMADGGVAATVVDAPPPFAQGSKVLLLEAVGP